MEINLHFFSRTNYTQLQLYTLDLMNSEVRDCSTQYNVVTGVVQSREAFYKLLRVCTFPDTVFNGPVPNLCTDSVEFSILIILLKISASTHQFSKVVTSVWRHNNAPCCFETTLQSIFLWREPSVRREVLIFSEDLFSEVIQQNELGKKSGLSFIPCRNPCQKRCPN